MCKSCVSVNHIYMSKLFTHIVVMYKYVFTLTQGPCKCFGSCKCIYCIPFVYNILLSVSTFSDIVLWTYNN